MLNFSPEEERALELLLHCATPTPAVAAAAPQAAPTPAIAAVQAVAAAATLWVFTDGACSGNGHKHAAAGYAAVVTTPDGKVLCETNGRVLPVELELPQSGLELVPKSQHRDATQCDRSLHQVQPSNNRGELLGIIAAFQLLLGSDAKVFSLDHRTQVTVFSDSRICIGTLTEWLPNRLAKGTAHELKNLDLIMAAWGLLGRLRARVGSVDIQYVAAHKREPPRGATPAERATHVRWAGNDRADRLAGVGVTLPACW